ETKSNPDSLRDGHIVKKYNPFLASIFNPQIQPFLKSYIAYNPAEEIQKLQIPVLLINGTNDIQVGEDQAQRLKEAYSNAQLLMVKGMNHVLKDVPDGDLTANMATYNNPELALSEELIPGIISFIEKL
ncbi:MAG: alpha/beta hydrolase, partial [Bacteroidota bacterium]